MKRTFILRARKARTDHRWQPTNLIQAGRMEIVCACISNAFCYAGHLRRDTTLHVVLEGPSRPPLILTIFGETLEGLSYEEQSIATLLHTILSTREVEKLSHPGITLEKGSFERLVEKYVEEGAQVFYLDKEGADIRQTSFADNPVFLFGDYIGMPAKTEKLLERKGVAQLTLGPTMLLASQCVSVVHNELDRLHTRR